MRIVNPKEYISSPRPTTNWIVDGLIPKPGYMLLLGPPKTGKSFLAWDIASKVAQGHNVLGHVMTNGPKKVLYVQLDTKDMAWTDRLRKFEDAGQNLDIPNLVMIHPDDLNLPMLVTESRGAHDLKLAITQSQAELVVIDVLREIHQEDENDSTGMKKVFDALEPLTRQVSVLLVHHTRKMSPDDKASPDPISLARGSSYITGRVDAFWLLYGDAPNRKLYYESRFQEASVQTARQDPNTGLFTFPDLENDATLIPVLLALCAEHPELGHEKLWKVASERIGLRRSSYYRLLKGTTCVHNPSHSPNPETF